MKNTNPANATSVAALKAQTQKEALYAHLKSVSTSLDGLRALADIYNVAQIADAVDVSRTLNKVLYQLTNVLQITLSRKYYRTDAEYLDAIQQHAMDIAAEIGETTFLLGQIVEHYEAVDGFYKIIKQATK